MYNQLDEMVSGRSTSANEIDLRVRELEKKYALMNALNHNRSTVDPLAGVKKATRRIAGLFSALFVG